jgi:hypothetical protein
MGIRVTLVFVVAQAAVLGGMRLAHPGEYPDPFAPYEAMIAGRSIAPNDLPCRLQTEHQIGETTVCRLFPADGVFASITSTTFDTGFVYTVFVTNDLRVGDIIQHWGQPDTVGKLGPYFMVIWEDVGLYGRIIPAVRGWRFDYLLPVASFTIGLR